MKLSTIICLLVLVSFAVASPIEIELGTVDLIQPQGSYTSADQPDGMFYYRLAYNDGLDYYGYEINYYDNPENAHEWGFVLDENTYGYVPEFEQFLTNGIDDNLTDKLWFVDGIGDYIFEYGNFESSRLQKNPGIAEGYPDFFGYDITRTEAPPIVFSTGYEDGITYYDIYMPLTIYGVEIPEPASLALFAFAALLFRKTTY